jgi:hypothetical protein
MNPSIMHDTEKAGRKRRNLYVLGLYCVFLPLPQFAQDTNRSMGTEIERFGIAEAKMVSRNSGLDPSRQPDVYWHDNEWRLDLLPLSSLNERYKLRISTGDGNKTSFVQLPKDYAQIRSILRNRDDKAIVIADISGTVISFCIVDLKSKSIIDQVAMYAPSVSPNRRFVLYVNGFAPHGSYGESEYHLYDTFKTPRENTCGFRENDPEHMDLDESYRGFQVYPSTKGGPCLGELPEGEDHQRVSEFVWSPDSNSVVFADAQLGTMTLVIVQMPSQVNDLPRTVVYPLLGAENVCGTECSNRNLHSLTWEGEQIRIALAYTPETGPGTENVMEVPLSKFVAAER